ncbi:FAD-binding protein, partial [Streptomyces niveus]
MTGTGTSAATTRNATSTWRNWAGNVSSRPTRTFSPASVEELAEAIRTAAADGLRVKAVGTGHSFTSAATT